MRSLGWIALIALLAISDAEALIGDSGLETDVYDWGPGVGVRLMY